MGETRVIHHYAVEGDVQTRHMVPAEASIVCAALRPRSKVAVYVEHMRGDKLVPMDVVFVGTGQDFTHWGLEYIGTVVDGPLVWHVYGKIHRG